LKIESKTAKVLRAGERQLGLLGVVGQVRSLQPSGGSGFGPAYTKKKKKEKERKL
jgi:hypothetical protein